MKQYITGFCLVIIAAAAAAFTMPKASQTFSSNADTYYFEFVGDHHDEADVSQWKEISPTEYNNLLCLGDAEGCRIATRAVSNPEADFPGRKILSVPVDGNDAPLATMDNIEVNNRNSQ